MSRRFCCHCGLPQNPDPTPCPHCGTEVLPHYDFCVGCGWEVGSSDPPAIPQQHPSPTEEAITPVSADGEDLVKEEKLPSRAILLPAQHELVDRLVKASGLPKYQWVHGWLCPRLEQGLQEDDLPDALPVEEGAIPRTIFLTRTADNLLRQAAEELDCSMAGLLRALFVEHLKQ